MTMYVSCKKHYLTMIVSVLIIMWLLIPQCFVHKRNVDSCMTHLTINVKGIEKNLLLVAGIEPTLNVKIRLV